MLGYVKSVDHTRLTPRTRLELGSAIRIRYECLL